MLSNNSNPKKNKKIFKLLENAQKIRNSTFDLSIECETCGRSASLLVLILDNCGLIITPLARLF